MRAWKERLAFHIGFLIGGIWLVVCSTLGIVWLLVRPGNRQTLYVFGRVYCRAVVRLMRWEVAVEGRERLDAFRPCVLVANHQSFLDVLTFGAMFPRRTVSAGKREIGRIPFFGWFFRLSGNLVIDRGRARSALESLDRASRVLRDERVSVWFMPEGHRNRGPELLPFKTGAFRLALAAGVPIVPLVAGPISAIVDPAARRARPGRLRVHVLEPVETQGLVAGDLTALVASVRDRMQREFDALRATG